ncbi:MAG: hypothetical protein KGJ55_02160 [Gammaproteobacteria bacterium]|nr:hypothetical protein [Gammaproteobacteria bacterium]
MRIAYGVMGYGRGHATRSAAVLPALSAEHEVTVFAGGDAHDWLAPRFATVRIPTLGYAYAGDGRHSPSRSVSRNAAPLADLLFGGPASRRLGREFAGRGIDLVISDSEAFCHRTAQRLGIPRISFDHVGIIAWCRSHFPPELWLAGSRDAVVYRLLMGTPQAILISSFYPAQPARAGVQQVGPILREAALARTPQRGDYLLAYFNKGEYQFLPQIERCLRLLELPVVVYGTARRGTSERLVFRAPSEQGFLDDLAGCRALICTAGNQLVGEAIHFRKPILALPEDAVEQRLNAHLIEQFGIGRRGDLRRLTPSDVDHFLACEDQFRRNMRGLPGDGRQAALDTLRALIRRLAPRQQTRLAVRGSARRGVPST